jgi:hypothetical protein
MMSLGRRILSSLIFGCLALLVHGAAAAEPRIALVIGNSAYERSPLANPVNDASDVAAALRNAGFEVILKTNASQGAMKEAIGAFGAALKAKEGVGLFFFAGHGAQAAGENYLLPVGQNIASEDDLKNQAITAAEVVDAMAAARNGLNIVILDACRDNPLTTGPNAVHGLSRIDSSASLFVSFSTSPGSVALDGQGRNSPYTKHLVQAIATPNISLEETFKRTLKGVHQETKGQQTPWISSSFFGDFSFRSAGNAPAVASLQTFPGQAIPRQISAAGQAAALGGLYQVNGSNPSGSRYRGVVALTPVGDKVRFTWWINSQIFTGLGQFAGRMLVVDWGSTHPVVYTFKGDGTLEGEWADGSATEKLNIYAPVAATAVGPPQGRYQVAGRNPDGSAYSGSLNISRQAARFLLSWQVGSSSYRGTGRLDGNVLIVDWGSTSPVVYTLAPDGSLRGLWSNGAAEEVNTPLR